MAFVLSIDDGARAMLNDNKVTPFTQNDLLKNVEVWDWRKQDAAVHKMLHYLAHVEQNPLAVDRVLDFINERDPEHDSLAYYQT